MCGIAGMLGFGMRVTEQTIRTMTDRMIPRGPDSSGCWIDREGRLGLGHRRLAIIDLSEAGHQPMLSACGRYSIIFNGEIYNFNELRRELEESGQAPVWRGHSDTEVLLAVFSTFGIREGLSRILGMFAMAVWDHQRSELSLARDRFGEKPLYYGWTQAGFVFASTLGAIKATPGFANPICPDALACLIARAYVPTPLSIYQGVAKLEPGCLLTLSSDAARNSDPAIDRYFDYAEQVLAGANSPISDRDEALETLDEVLSQAVGRQLVADVPVGNFLSGGIDSSLITAIAQKRASRPLKTFTIGFSEAGFDEAVYARQVAKALGTDHTELYVSAADALAVIPQLPGIYDEPFADSSQIPTFLVSQLARQNVTVSLSGDGGDELFGGYNRHVQFPRLWRMMRKVPRPLRSMGLGAVSSIPPSFWNGMSDLAHRRRSVWFGHNASRALSVMATAPTFDSMFDRFLDDWAMQSSPLRDARRCARPLRIDPRLKHLPLEVQMMHADAVTYLPDDILTKVDRAGMAVSLESRIPFLDPEVTALAARIDPALKFARGGGKAILKDLLYRYVPRQLVDRPKAGFAIPVGIWLKGPLKDWAEDLLSHDALCFHGLFDIGAVRSRWARHLAGEEDATQALWSILIFQAWHRTNR